MDGAFCMLCFSADRTLSTVDGAAYRALASTLGLTAVLSPERKQLRACWECGAMILRFQRFKQRAVRALLLLSSVHSIAELKCLSPLSRSSMIVIDSNNIPPERNNSTLSPPIDVDSLMSCEISDEIKIETDEDLEKLPKGNAWVEPMDLKNYIPTETVINTDIEVSKEEIYAVENLTNNYVDASWDDVFFDGMDNSISDNDGKVNDIQADSVKYNGNDKEVTQPHDEKPKGKRVTGVRKKRVNKRSRVIVSVSENPPDLPSLIQEGKLEEFVCNDDQMQKAWKEMASILPRKLRCAACLERFSDKEALRAHTLERHSEAGGAHACDICGLRFAEPEPLAGHRAAHKLYRCMSGGCDFVSASPSLSVWHARSRIHSGPNQKWDPDHQLTKLIECNKVEKFFGTTQEVLKAHRILLNLVKFTMRGSLSCQSCAIGFTTQPQLDRHNHLCHSKAAGPHVCDICGSRFSTLELLVGHVDGHYTLYRCRHAADPGCEFICPVPSRVVSHVRQHDRFKKQPSKKVEQDRTCKVCGGVFRTRQYFIIHMRVHTSTRCYECDICGKTYKTRYQIARHIKRHAMRYMCETCGKRCPSSSALKAHSLAHMDHSLRRFECHECGKKYINRPKLIAHLMYHSGERPHKCTDCDRDYADPYALTMHRKLAHGGEERQPKFARTKSAYRNKPTRSFVRPATESKPKGVRTSKRPREDAPQSLECSVCGKTFKNRFTLRVHFSIHSDARPYKCDRCDKSFKVYAGLYQHKFVHRGAKPYECDVCGSAYASRHGLTVHKAVHSEDKPHECNICHKRFRYKSKLLKHVQTHDVVVKDSVDRA